MKARAFLKAHVTTADVHSLLAFFGGTTLALFNKKHFLFDGFHPIFYAALFGFMISLAFKSLRDNDIINKFEKKSHFKDYAVLTFLLTLGLIALLALSIFIVWYSSRLQGVIVLDNVNFWPQALFLCLCLAAFYSFYSFMENKYFTKLFC
ncbi:MAG TPA: hypothetical protein VFN30_04060 [Chitinophagaceae bacterium]|nr:hypothetical protein [Chitinophagaceae bacterium]